MTDDTDDLHPVDADALRRCMEQRPELESRLVDRPFLPAEPWIEVAGFAAYSVQRDALRLKLWQLPPCSLSEDGNVRACDIEGQILLRRMIAAGLSIYEPDPLAALAAKAKRKRAKPKRAKRPAKSAAQ